MDDLDRKIAENLKIEPRNMEDPDMTVMLLKEIIREGVNPVGSDWDAKTNQWSKFQMDGIDDLTHWDYSQLPRAIKLAYAKAHGIAAEGL